MWLKPGGSKNKRCRYLVDMAELPPIVALEGIFAYSSDPAPDIHGNVNPAYRDLVVEGEDGVARSAYEALKKLDGHPVRLIIHHVPDTPPNPHRWGGGACMWQTKGTCPFGHHDHPSRLFAFEGEGILNFTLDHAAMDGGWELERGEDSTTIPLGWTLVGHRARILAVPLMEGAGLAENMADISSLTDRLTQAEQILRSLKGLAEKNE